MAGAEALELGLLFGTENLTPQEEDVLCFSHLLLQEFMAGKYVSELKRVQFFQLRKQILNSVNIVNVELRSCI